ncbi:MULTISPECIES: hypothetical protein [Larkinella]|jgi:hypothetical protein|uniref:Lipocalin-like protein n=1 Tax=Larkinella humicola TaxID=2607654 RepID=A0A5N1JJ31_9BACT|nr:MULTISPECIES: hypothetical protein [Larkinella]KAA9353142.1 hypothetical protein F0P93_18420 [Larkinella humicola]
MKKTTPIAFVAVLTLFAVLTGCNKDKTTPLSDRIKKNWTAQKVEENNVVVYTKGGTSNVKPGYSQYSLDLSNPPTVVIKQVDGFTSTGQYELQGDTKLILKSLSPAPTDGPTIEFNIGTATETSLELTRTTADRKTGGTTNKYTLANP